MRLSRKLILLKTLTSWTKLNIFFALVTIIVSELCCGAECPIECYCDAASSITVCTGDRTLSGFPQQYINPLQGINEQDEGWRKDEGAEGEPGSSGSFNKIITRLEFHDYHVPTLSRATFLAIIHSYRDELRELDLRRNDIQQIENTTFIGATFSSTYPYPPEEQEPFSLDTLNLSENQLTCFTGGDLLSQLKNLDLSINYLQQVRQLQSLTSLSSINLKDNRISVLSPDVFQNLPNLQYINLEDNYLDKLEPSVFSNLPSLIHLILSKNPIGNPSPGFHWNSRVQFIDVSHVGLTYIPTSLTKTVRDFRCSNNNLTVIHKTDFESFPNLGLIILDENQIQFIEDDAFGRLDFLTRLWINGNRLKRIPQNLPSSLRSLHVEENEIKNLTSTDFQNLSNLDEINLHGNRINSLSPFIFRDLIRLRSLDLRGNNIDVIYKDSFTNLKNLISLDISQNPIKVIVTGSFNSLQKLSLFHLSRLKEPTVELDSKSFQTLEHLQILQISDSPALAKKLVQDSALTYFPNLIELNVQRCELSNLQSLANSVLQLNLHAIKLSGNPWDCHQLFRPPVPQLISKNWIADEPTCALPASLKDRKFLSLINHSDSHILLKSFTSPPSHFSSSNNPSNSKSFKHFSLPSTNFTSQSSFDAKRGPAPVYPDTSPSLIHSLANSSTSAASNKTNAERAQSKETLWRQLGDVNARKISIFHRDAQDNASKHAEDRLNTKGLSEKDMTPTMSYFDSGPHPLFPPVASPTDNNYNNNNPNNGNNIYYNNEEDLSASLGDSDEDEDEDASKSLETDDTNESNENHFFTQRNKKLQIHKDALTETMTNDDNTIMDEKSWNDEHRENKTAPTDGFPLSHPAIFASNSKKLDSFTKSGTSQPRLSYLKSQGRKALSPSHKAAPFQERDESGMILKTLIICISSGLVSIVIVLTISYTVYRISKARSFAFQTRSQIYEDDEKRSEPRMAYSRFGKHHSTNHKSNFHPDVDGESDHVELSGITNTLYFDNEEIFHIS